MADDGAVALVCPACRRAEEGRLLYRGLARDGAVLRCACGRRYPVIDGVPVVLTELRQWAESEGAPALRRRDIADEVVDLVATDTATARNQRLLRAYREAPASPLSGWVSSALSGSTTPILEIGAGIGHPGTIRLDLNLTLLLAGPPVPPLVDGPDGVMLAAGAAIVADATDPPFLAGSFATVAVLNLLDSCRDPALALAQADALVGPGGKLVVACAYAFSAEVTPEESWFDEHELLAALAGNRTFRGHALDCRLVAEPEDLDWELPAGPRTRHVHRVQVLVARRPG